MILRRGYHLRIERSSLQASRQGNPHGGRTARGRADDARAVVLYDRDCGFCRWSLAQLLALDRKRRLRPVPLQSPEAEAMLAGMEPERRFASAHLVSPDGGVYSGGDALAPTLRLLPGGLPLSVVARAMTAASRGGYDWVARHRRLLGRPLSDRAKARATERIDRHG